MFTEEQKQHILDVVQQTADGMFTKGEMVRKLEAICKQADPNARFEEDGIQVDAAAEAEIAAILTSTSTMTARP